jgi:hypothetical protein
MEYKRLEHGEVFDFDAGTTTKTKNVTILSTSENKEIHCTHFGDLVFDSEDLDKGGILLVKLIREGTDPADTFNGDARLVSSHIVYISDSRGNDNI